MIIRKLLTAGILVGLASCIPQEEKPKQKIFPFDEYGKITSIQEVGFYDRSLGLAAADFDDNGTTDLAVAREDGKVMLYKNDNEGNYTLVGQIAEIPNPSINSGLGLAAADFDGDGDIDLAVARNDGIITLYRNEGTDKLIKTVENQDEPIEASEGEQ